MKYIKELKIPMRLKFEFGGHRIIIISGRYKGKKGFVSFASDIGIFVDLDFNGLRVEVEPINIRILSDK